MDYVVKKIKTMIDIKRPSTANATINKFLPEHVTSKVIIHSNFLFNLSNGILFDIPIYMIDIKFIQLNSELLSILKTVIESNKDIDKHYLQKIGYIHDTDKQMMSLIYYKGDLVQLNIEQVMNDKRLSLTKENETITKLCILNQYLSNFKQHSPFDMLLLHPELMFYSTCRGMVYFDYIFSAIYDSCKNALSPIILKYYGQFDIKNKDEKQSKINAVIMLCVYYFSSSFIGNNSTNKHQKQLISYESIIHKITIDYYNNDHSFTNLSLLIPVEYNKPLITFITSALSSNIFTYKQLLISFNELYYKLFTKDIKCLGCNITSNQIEHNKFTIHFPCFDIICKNCLSNHKCIDIDFIQMVEAKKSDLITHSIFARNHHNKIGNSMLSSKYESYQKDFLKSFKETIDQELIIATGKEATLNNMTKIIFNDMRLTSYNLRNSYKNLSEQSIGDMKKKEAILFEWDCCNQKLMTLGQKYKLLSIHCKERSSVIKSEVGTILVNFPSYLLSSFRVLRNRLVNQIITVANIIKFKSSILDEFSPVNKYHTILSYVEANSNIILSLNAHRSKIDKPKILQIKLKEGFTHGFCYLNMKTMLIITGGQHSNDAYCLYYPENNSIDALNEDCFESIVPMKCHREGHAMIAVKNYIFCIGGKNNNQWEYYDLFTETWTLLSSTLPKNYMNSSLCLYNNVDLYLFLGYATKDKTNDYTSAMDIIKTRLFESDSPQWEIVKYHKPKDFSTLVFFSIVPMTYNQIIITGGLFQDKENMANYAIYSFNFESNVLKMEKRHPKWGNEKMLFYESSYYEIEDKSYAIFGSTKQIIHIKGK